MSPVSQPPAHPAYPAHPARLWGALDALYGALVAWLALTFIPKDPVFPALIASYGLLSALGGVGLWRGARWGWRLASLMALVGLTLGLALAGLTLMAGFYWLGVFGVLGWGVFISSGLLISGIFQLLALYPALKIRRLMSEEVRGFFFPAGGPSCLPLGDDELSAALSPPPHPTRPHPTSGGWVRRYLKLCVLLTLTCPLLGAYWGRAPSIEPLTDAQRALVVSYLRAELEGDKQALPTLAHTSSLTARRDAALAPLKGVPLGPAPLTVTLWAAGARLARATGRGADLAEAVRDAGESLTSHPKLSGRRIAGGRLVVDRAVALKPLPTSLAPALSLSVDPGVDGLVSVVGGRTRTLLPSDLVEQQRFGVAPIVPGVPELRLGLDAAWALERLGAEGLHRLRTEQWAEVEELSTPEERAARGGAPVPVALTLRSNLDAEASALRASLASLAPHERMARRAPDFERAAHRAGLYLTRHINADGRFDYQYFPYTNTVTQPGGSAYSLPRHAGAIYGLALLYEADPRPAYRDTAERAVEWLRAQASPACGGWLRGALCIPLAGQQEVTLGNSALSALALLTHARATGDERHISFTRGLLSFLAHMQRADGDFFHSYSLADGAYMPQERAMFASEQAALAFTLAAQRWPGEGWLERAERALDALTALKYERDFLSRFFYGADHWTCLAASAAWPLLKHRRYLDFCLGYSRFLQRLQYRARLGEGDESFDGHYGFGFFSPPQAPATGGFGEGVMATLALARAHGVRPEEVSDIYDQAHAGLEALTRDQIRPENRWPFPDAARVEGAIRRSLVESEVRVDFVQHSACALLMSRGLVAPLSPPHSAPPQQQK